MPTMMSNASCCVISLLIVLIGFRKYRERKWGYCKNNEKLDGKIALVTGANSGIGYEVAKELASRNAIVVLACRNLDLAKKATERIESELQKNVRLITMELDLASLKSVKKFSVLFKKQFPEVHLLFNNAGVSYPKSGYGKATEDGFEIHFGVNHLGHFYLTNLLLDIMKDTRIVVVTSKLHERGVMDFEKMSQVKYFPPNVNLYSNSKLANVYFCKELAKRLEDTNIKVYGVLPGWVYTSLFRNSVRWYHYILVAPIAYFFMRGAHQGAQTSIYCATEPALENETGYLYRDCKQYQPKLAFDDKVGVRLWEESEKLIKQIIK